jgi:hypothetical protein
MFPASLAAHCHQGVGFNGGISEFQISKMTLFVRFCGRVREQVFFRRCRLFSTSENHDSVVGSFGKFCHL